jgi:hypothetical protein
MTIADLILIAMIAAFIGWIWYEIHRAPTERDDMTRSEQEDAADEAADSMRGSVEQLRKDGAL